MSKKTWFSWSCNCKHKNKSWITGEFEVPSKYWQYVTCAKCEAKHKIVIGTDWGDPDRKEKPFTIKRREKDEGTKKDRAYRNDHGRH